MTYISRTALLISTFTVALFAQGTAFAQTVLVAEAPLAAVPNATLIQTSELNQSQETAAQNNNSNAADTTDDNKLVDESRWLLKPNDPPKVLKDYSQEFAGLRLVVLSGRDAKIGTSTQFNDAGYRPSLNLNKGVQDVYGKVDDNFLVRAKIDF